MICPECEENLHPVGHPRCFLCGKPVNAGEYCRDCEKHHHLFDQGIGIFVYDERMRRSVTRYKYYGCREYGDFYAAAMYRFGRKEILRWDPQLIVPVPIHRTKLRMRGFNQSEYLAERLGRYTGILIWCRKYAGHRPRKNLLQSSAGRIWSLRFGLPGRSVRRGSFW